MEQGNNSPNLLIIVGALWLLLAVALLAYQLTTPATIKVEWETATEVETAGFNLYRSQSPDEEFIQVNPALIPNQGDATSGGAYSYEDNKVQPGVTYYYLLEEVELSSVTNRYEEDMFAYRVPRISWWAMLLAAVSLLAGLALIVTGLRERKAA